MACQLSKRTIGPRSSIAIRLAGFLLIVNGVAACSCRVWMSCDTHTRAAIATFHLLFYGSFSESIIQHARERLPPWGPKAQFFFFYFPSFSSFRAQFLYTCILSWNVSVDLHSRLIRNRPRVVDFSRFWFDYSPMRVYLSFIFFVSVWNRIVVISRIILYIQLL